MESHVSPGPTSLTWMSWRVTGGEMVPTWRKEEPPLPIWIGSVFGRGGEIAAGSEEEPELDAPIGGSSSPRRGGGSRPLGAAGGGGSLPTWMPPVCRTGGLAAGPEDMVSFVGVPERGG